MKIRLVTASSVLFALLAGCSHQSTFLVKPGYYQQGRYLKAENVGPYYDSLGHFHPKRTISAHYQPGRWHEAQYRTEEYAKRVYATPEDVGLMASDADLP